MTTNPPAARVGSYRVGDLDINRIGYGAMRLAGPGVFGPPSDRAAAIEVLRTAVELGVNHIDTADAYGPFVTNEIIREALFPYGEHVHIVTKVGVVRDERGGWLPGNSPESVRAQVHDNLRRLGLDVLDVVYLRTLVGIDDRAEASDTLVPPRGLDRHPRAPPQGLRRGPSAATGTEAATTPTTHAPALRVGGVSHPQGRLLGQRVFRRHQLPGRQQVPSPPGAGRRRCRHRRDLHRRGTHPRPPDPPRPHPRTRRPRQPRRPPPASTPPPTTPAQV